MGRPRKASYDDEIEPVAKKETDKKPKKKAEETALFKALRFVGGAVAKKDYIPALTHFSLSSGRITGFNGFVAISSPAPLDLTVCPRADVFAKAIDSCVDVAQISATDSPGKIMVKSGNLRVFVDCLTDGSYPKVAPEGRYVNVTSPLLSVFKLMYDFVSTDTGKAWANGLYFRGGSVLATNNTALVEYWIGHEIPCSFLVPQIALKELIRIDEEPTQMQISENSVTFHFQGDRWLRTQTTPVAWPDTDTILAMDKEPPPFPRGFFAALEDVRPFVNKEGSVYFSTHGIHTTPHPAEGAIVDIRGFERGIFPIKQLIALGAVATGCDFAEYPRPCHFVGPRLRGVILGSV